MAPFIFFKLGHPKIVDDLKLKMSKTNVEMSFFRLTESHRVLEMSHSSDVYLSMIKLPSGKHTNNYGKSPCYQWLNPLFLWSFSIANCNKLPEGTNFMDFPASQVLFLLTIYGIHFGVPFKGLLEFCARQSTVKNPGLPSGVIKHLGKFNHNSQQPES
jgi:hypothetical protein